MLGVAAMAVPAVVSLTATRVDRPAGDPDLDRRRLRRRRARRSGGVRRHRRAVDADRAAAPSWGGPSCRRPRTATRSASRCARRWPTSWRAVAHVAGVGRRRCSPDRCCSPTGGGCVGASACALAARARRVGVATLAQAVAAVVRARADRRRRARSRRARRDADGAAPRAGGGCAWRRPTPRRSTSPGPRPDMRSSSSRASRRRRSWPPRRRRRAVGAIHFTACLVGPTRPGQLLRRPRRARRLPVG